MMWEIEYHVIQPYHWHLNVMSSPSFPFPSSLSPLLPLLQWKSWPLCHHCRPHRATIVACVIPPSLSIVTIVSSNPFSSCRMYYHLKLCSLELKNLISSHSFILSGFSLPLSHHHFVCALLSLSLYLGSRKEDNIHSASLARSKAFHFPNAQALVPIFPCWHHCLCYSHLPNSLPRILN